MHPLQKELAEIPADVLSNAVAHVLPLSEQGAFVAFVLCGTKLRHTYGRTEEELTLLVQNAMTNNEAFRAMLADVTPLDFIQYLADLEAPELLAAFTFCAVKLAHRHNIPLEGLNEMTKTAVEAEDAAVVAAMGK